MGRLESMGKNDICRTRPVKLEILLSRHLVDLINMAAHDNSSRTTSTVMLLLHHSGVGIVGANNLVKQILAFEGEYLASGNEIRFEIDLDEIDQQKDKPKPVAEVEIEEWVDWEGGMIPIDEDHIVSVKKRNGLTVEGFCAGEWIWVWDEVISDQDIIAYKVTGQTGGSRQ